MTSSEGSGKWVLAIFIAIAAVVFWSYPTQTLFVLRFIWDLIAQNVRTIIQGYSHH